MKLNLAVVALVLAATSTVAVADVNDTGSERRLSLPSISPGIALPKDDWLLQREQRRPGDTAAYYLLSSESRKITFSVYIDKTAVCQSAASCLESSMKNPQYKEAKEMEHADEGIFKLVSFRLSQPNGAPMEQANIQASAYVDGVWFDVHLSKAAKDRPDMASLREVLRQISVK